MKLNFRQATAKCSSLLPHTACESCMTPLPSVSSWDNALYLQQTPGLSELQSALDEAQEANLGAIATEVSALTYREELWPEIQSPWRFNRHGESIVLLASVPQKSGLESRSRSETMRGWIVADVSDVYDRLALYSLTICIGSGTIKALI